MDEGYGVANVRYPSREYPIESLSRIAVERGLEMCPPDTTRVHFVMHSLGGILVRHYLAHHRMEKLGRVVMLASPNQGSEVVPGPNDGKVSIERAKVEGMADFVLVPHAHPFIMDGRDTRAQTISFLKTGRFVR